MYIFRMPNSEILCVYLFIIFGDFVSYFLVLFCLLFFFFIFLQNIRVPFNISYDIIKFLQVF